MIRFSIFGIPIAIQPFFWATLGIIGFLSNEGRGAEALIYVALFMLAGFVSILIHELGHAVTGRLFRARSEIVLHAFGGFAIFPGARFHRGQSFFVTLAGPAAQIAAGVVVWIAFTVFPTGLPNDYARNLVGSFVWISIFWAGLNLIPVIPLDGGQLMATLLGPKRLKVSLIVSMVFAIGGAVLLLLRDAGIFMPLFLASFAWQNYEMLKRQSY